MKALQKVFILLILYTLFVRKKTERKNDKMQATGTRNTPEVVVDEARIRKFFFNVMVPELKRGIDPPAVPIPGFSRVTFRDGDLFLQDLCCVGRSGSSASMLTISSIENGHPIPLWYMSCSGYCRTKEARQFLNLALLETYEAGRFIGGRGPSRFQKGNFVYSNKPACENFDVFSGSDTIFRQAEPGEIEKLGSFVGWFRFNGGFL